MKNIIGLISYLKNTLHISAAISDKKLDYMKSMPIAIKSNYDIFNLRIQDKGTVLLSTNEKDIGSIKKHLNLFEESLSIPVIVHIEHISSSTKKYMIENGIPFISEEAIYLPQLLIYFDDFKEKYKKVKSKKLSKLAQTILISLIVKRQHGINNKDSAIMFDVTKMSTSRALNELADFNYLDMQQIGRTKEYFLKHHIDIEKLFMELKNPVIDTIFIKHQDLNYFDRKTEASYSALTKYTNITNSSPIFAVEKDYFNRLIKKDNPITIYDKEYDNNLIQIELWKYKPEIVDDGVADPISLYMSLKDQIDIYDSRVNNAMNELYNKIEGMIN
ncbi:hypothetical protein [Sulfurimonas sp.]|uniref:hypothetical protein n=1 Tax=Sulfurimonas sp. TaxID=2022749 RepID=UPI0025F8862E|nr:hypothetical protein [Sulfurimonas sp.]